MKVKNIKKYMKYILIEWKDRAGKKQYKDRSGRQQYRDRSGKKTNCPKMRKYVYNKLRE